MKLTGLLTNISLILFAFVMAVFSQTTILAAPDKPFSDDNDDGINDLDQNIQDSGDPETRAKIYGINFPIAELGNCGSYYECRSFCEDPVNSASCFNFGKQRGLYKDQEDTQDKEKVLEKAKQELGCDSYETCKSFCQISSNFDKCNAFAKKQGMSGGHVDDPKNEAVLEKAKGILGCDSYASCASFCSDDTNRQQCSDFAKQTGLKGGEQKVGPGGCTSEATCKSFCSDPVNFQVCNGFTASSGGQFQGPGGCDSEGSCRSYCEKNPQDCGFRSEGGANQPVPIKYDPQEMCNKTPACSWKDNTCLCGSYKGEEMKNKADEYSKICRENPQRCTPGGIGGSESQEDRAAFEKYCREKPERCKPAYSDMMGGRNYDPARECSRYAGCAWTNGTCQCGIRYEVPAPGTPPPFGSDRSVSSGQSTGSSGGGYDSREEQERGCKSGGGSCDWGYGYCYCRGYQSSGNTYSGSPADTTNRSYTRGDYTGNAMSRESQESGCRAGGGTCSWNGDICNCQAFRSNNTGWTNTTSGNSGGVTATPAPLSNTTINTTSNTAPPGMSRESQESGCRSCGGTCSWSGDFCNCQCSGSGGGGSSTPAPAPAQPAPAPVQEQPAQESKPQETTSESSGGSSGGGGGCPSGSYMKDGACVQGVQGVSTARGLLQILLDQISSFLR